MPPWPPDDRAGLADRRLDDASGAARADEQEARLRPDAAQPRGSAASSPATAASPARASSVAVSSGVETRTIDSGSPARAIVAGRLERRAASRAGTRPGTPRARASARPGRSPRSRSRAGPPSRARAGGGPGRRPTPGAAAAPASRPAPRRGRRRRASSIRPKPDRLLAGRPRRDPAAERRALERLREVAERQAVRRERRLEVRPDRAARRTSRGRSARRGRAGPASRSRAIVMTVGRRPRRGRDAADDARPAAVRDDARPGRRGEREELADSSPASAGRATASGTAPSRPLAQRDPVGQALAAGVADASTGSRSRRTPAAESRGRDGRDDVVERRVRAAAAPARSPLRAGRGRVGRDVGDSAVRRPSRSSAARPPPWCPIESGAACPGHLRTAATGSPASRARGAGSAALEQRVDPPPRGRDLAPRQQPGQVPAEIAAERRRACARGPRSRRARTASRASPRARSGASGTGENVHAVVDAVDVAVRRRPAGGGRPCGRCC